MATVGAMLDPVFGRGAVERSGMVVTMIGGNPDSEAAVAAALKWLAEHQNQDGSWNFDHRTGPCNGRCSDPGTVMDCRTGATAMALCRFSARDRRISKASTSTTSSAALYFLKGQMKIRNQGSLQQAICPRPRQHVFARTGRIALCEAYAMTHDRKLMGPAQFSLNYIVYAQDPVGGGWRYWPRSRATRRSSAGSSWPSRAATWPTSPSIRPQFRARSSS